MLDAYYKPRRRRNSHAAMQATSGKPAPPNESGCPIVQAPELSFFSGVAVFFAACVAVVFGVAAFVLVTRAVAAAVAWELTVVFGVTPWPAMAGVGATALLPDASRSPTG